MNFFTCSALRVVWGFAHSHFRASNELIDLRLVFFVRSLCCGPLPVECEQSHGLTMSALQIDGVGPALHINYDFILSLMRLLLRDLRLVPARIRVNQLINANMISFGLFLATHRLFVAPLFFFFAGRKLAPKNWAELKANFGWILIHYMRKRSQTSCAIFSHLQLDAHRPIRERYKNHAPKENGKCCRRIRITMQWPLNMMAMDGEGNPHSYKNRIFNLSGKNAVGLKQREEGKLLSWRIAVFGEEWSGKFASQALCMFYVCSAWMNPWQWMREPHKHEWAAISHRHDKNYGISLIRERAIYRENM